MHGAEVHGDVVAERLEERGEAAVQVVAVPAATGADEAGHGRFRVEVPLVTEMDPGALVRERALVGPVQLAQRRERRRSGLRADAREVRPEQLVRERRRSGDAIHDPTIAAQRAEKKSRMMSVALIVCVVPPNCGRSTAPPGHV